jgi:hypothetical protein
MGSVTQVSRGLVTATATAAIALRWTAAHRDGWLHIAMDTHNIAVYYVKPTAPATALRSIR